MNANSIIRNNNFRLNKPVALVAPIDVEVLSPEGKCLESGAIMILPGLEKVNTFVHAYGDSVRVYERKTGVFLCEVQNDSDWCSTVRSIVATHISLCGDLEKYALRLLEESKNLRQS